MRSATALLLFPMSASLLEGQLIYIHDVYDMAEQDSERAHPYHFNAENPIYKAEDAGLYQFERDIDAHCEIDDTSAQCRRHCGSYPQDTSIDPRDQAFEGTSQNPNKRLSTRSDRPEGLGRTKNSVKDIPLDLRHQVLQWAMTEERKKQADSQTQLFKHSGNIAHSEQEEFSALQNMRSSAITGQGQARRWELENFRNSQKRTEQHKQDLKDAATGMMESGMMIKTVGSLNKDMRKRMEKSFNPLSTPKAMNAFLPLPIAPTGLSRPKRHGGSISTMEDSQKHRVLEWVMQDQQSIQKKAANIIPDILERKNKASRSADENFLKWFGAKDVDAYRKGKHAESHLLRVQELAGETYKALSRTREEAGNRIETIGMLNRHMRNRMLKTSLPLPNPKRPDAGRRRANLPKHSDTAKQPERTRKRFSNLLKQAFKGIKNLRPGKKAGAGTKSAGSETKKTSGGLGIETGSKNTAANSKREETSKSADSRKKEGMRPKGGKCMFRFPRVREK